MFQRRIESTREVAYRDFRATRHQDALAVDRGANPDPEGDQRLPDLRAGHQRHDRFLLTIDGGEKPPLPRFQRETTAGAWPIGRPDVSR